MPEGASAPIETLSNTVMLGRMRRFWKVRPMPSWAMRCGRMPTSERALEADLALARRDEPGDQVEQRGLAGAVRPDQADQLMRVDVAGDGIDRDQPLEAAGDDC